MPTRADNLKKYGTIRDKVQAPVLHDLTKKEEVTQLDETLQQVMRGLNRHQDNLVDVAARLFRVDNQVSAVGTQTTSLGQRVVQLEAQVSALQSSLTALSTAYNTFITTQYDVHIHEITVATAAGGTPVNIVGGAAGTFRSSTGGVAVTGTAI